MAIQLSDVLGATAQITKTPIEELRNERRGPHRVSHIRNMAFYLSRELCGASYPKIGRFYYRDHSTVLHGIDWLMERLEVKQETIAKIAERAQEIALARQQYEAMQADILMAEAAVQQASVIAPPETAPSPSP